MVFPWKFPFFLFSTEEKRLVVQAGTNLQLTYGTYDILLTFYDRRGLDLQRGVHTPLDEVKRGWVVLLMIRLKNIGDSWNKTYYTLQQLLHMHTN